MSIYTGHLIQFLMCTKNQEQEHDYISDLLVDLTHCIFYNYGVWIFDRLITSEVDSDKKNEIIINKSRVRATGSD